MRRPKWKDYVEIHLITLTGKIIFEDIGSGKWYFQTAKETFLLVIPTGTPQEYLTKRQYLEANNERTVTLQVQEPEDNIHTTGGSIKRILVVHKIGE